MPPSPDHAPRDDAASAAESKSSRAVAASIAITETSNSARALSPPTGSTAARTMPVKKSLGEDEAVGADIVWRALSAPTKQIAANGGLDGSVVAQKIEDSTDVNFGFNAATQKYEDLVASGIIVPTKVERVALQNAASIAGLLLTTDCAITEVKEKKAKAAAGHGHGEDY